MLIVSFYIEKIKYNKNIKLIFFVYLQVFVMLYNIIIENIKIVNTVQCIYFILYLYDRIIKEIYV